MRRCNAALRVFCAATLVISTFGSTAFCQHLCPELLANPDSRFLWEQYRKECVTLEAIGEGISTAGAFGISEHTSWNRWIAHRGYEALSESAFFRLCGHEEEARRAENRRASIKSRTGLGIVLSLGGLVVCLIAAGRTKKECGSYLCVEVSDPNTGVGITAGIVSILGSILVLSAQGDAKRNLVPLGQARMIGDEYNDRLCRKLAESIPDELETDGP